MKEKHNPKLKNLILTIFLLFFLSVFSVPALATPANCNISPAFATNSITAISQTTLLTKSHQQSYITFHHEITLIYIPAHHPSQCRRHDITHHRPEGHNYLINRYYNADRDSFLSPDKYDFVDQSMPYSMNLYQYGYANPLVNVDPEGLLAEADMRVKHHYEEERRKQLEPYGIPEDEYFKNIDHGYHLKNGVFSQYFSLSANREIPEQLRNPNHQAINGRYWFEAKIRYIEGNETATIIPVSTRDEQLHVGMEGINETVAEFWGYFWNPAGHITNRDGSINWKAVPFALMDMAGLSKGAAHMVGGIITGTIKQLLKEAWRTKSLRPLFAAGRTSKSDAEVLRLLQTETGLVRKILPELRGGYREAFDGPIRIRTFKKGQFIYRSPALLGDEVLESSEFPGNWFLTRATKTKVGTESQACVLKYGNPLRVLRKYQFTEDVSLYYGKIANGKGYQALFPRDINPASVLKLIDEWRLK